jgi:membrane protein DedA with SNARE-associated domain
VLLLAIVGREVGGRWDQWRDNLHYVDYVVLAAIVAGIVYLVVRRRRAGTQSASTPPA